MKEDYRELLPAEVRDVLATVQHCVADTCYKNRVYLVGGMVRDTLLGYSLGICDIDFVTDLEVEPLLELLSPIAKGPATYYGQCYTGMLVTKNGLKLEFVRARKEKYIPGSRTPSVEPATLAEDAKRRDFTVNSMMLGLDGQLLDHCGGLDDLKKKVLRSCGKPHEMFYDDPLRLLRLIRFAVRFNFRIEHLTGQACSLSAHRLYSISPERIRDELVKIFRTNPVEGLNYLADYRLLQSSPLATLWRMYGQQQNDYHRFDVWGHTVAALEELCKHDVSYSDELVWAVLLHDVGKIPMGIYGGDSGWHFYGHEDASVLMAREILEALRFPNDFIVRVCKLVGMHMRKPDDKWSDSAYRKLYRDAVSAPNVLDDLISLQYFDFLASNPQAFSYSYDRRAVMEKLMDSIKEVDVMKSPLSGDEIMDILGCEPGPQVGRCKSDLIAAVIDGTLSPEDRDGAVALVRKSKEN